MICTSRPEGGAVHKSTKGARHAVRREDPTVGGRTSVVFVWRTPGLPGQMDA